LIEACRRLTDADLMDGLERAVRCERGFAALSIAHLIEISQRRLHEDEGYSSLFEFCTKKLGYSEGSAYKRIQAARAAAEFPALLEALANGRIHLTALVILRPHLTADNYGDMLSEAEGKSKRELEHLAASLSPRPDLRDHIQRIPLPESQPGESPAASDSSPENERSSEPDARVPHPPIMVSPTRIETDSIRPISPERVHFGFTGGEPLRVKIQRLKELLRHKHPAGKLEDVIDAAAEFYLERKDPDRRKETFARKPRAGLSDHSRRVPQSVRSAVWKRDDGRCSFVSKSGQRCSARGGLEFDHIVPWAVGGRSDAVENIRLLCRAHNQGAAIRRFGDRARRRREPQ